MTDQMEWGSFDYEYDFIEHEHDFKGSKVTNAEKFFNSAYSTCERLRIHDGVDFLPCWAMFIAAVETAPGGLRRSCIRRRLASR